MNIVRVKKSRVERETFDVIFSLLPTFATILYKDQNRLSRDNHRTFVMCRVLENMLRVIWPNRQIPLIHYAKRQCESYSKLKSVPLYTVHMTIQDFSSTNNFWVWNQSKRKNRRKPHVINFLKDYPYKCWIQFSGLPFKSQLRKNQRCTKMENQKG